MTVVAIFIAAVGILLWVRHYDKYRLIDLCVEAGGTWDYQATRCKL